jgi:hypothetical protein
VLLRALLEAPRLRLRLLTGEQALDRRIAGIFTTDLLDPRRYLSGGEIVLTGLMWRRAPEDSETFVVSLTEAGVSALAAGDAAFGSVPTDLVDACRRHRLPLLEVPVDVSFAAITEHVLRSSTPFGPLPPRPRLRTGADIGGAARAAGTEPSGDSVAALFTVAASEYGLVGWVVSPVGRLVTGSSQRPGRSRRPGPGAGSGRDAASGRGVAPGRASVSARSAVPGRALVSGSGVGSGRGAGSRPPKPGPAPDGALWPALAAGYLSAHELPVTITVDGEPFSLFPIAGPPAHRLTDWFVAFQGDSDDWAEEWREVAGELTRFTAAFRAGQRERRRSRRRLADELLWRVLAGREDADEPQPAPVAEQMRRCGISAGQRVVAAVAGLSVIAGPEPVADMAETYRTAGGEAQWDAGAESLRFGTVGEAQRVARAVLEEMLPDAPVAVCGDEVVAVVPCAETIAATDDSNVESVASSAGTSPLVTGADAVLERVRAAVGTLWMGLPELDLSLGVSVSSCKTSGRAKRANQGSGAMGEKSRPVAGAGQVPPTEFVAGARNDSAAELAAISLCRAIDEAREAKRVAALLGGGVRMVDSAQLGTYDLLLALVPEEARRTFRARVLGPVLAYDRQHGTELIHTLEVFLACSGSWTKAAGEMYVHVNSLRYRIRRIEELTGRDLGSLSDQTDLLLAMRLGA